MNRRNFLQLAAMSGLAVVAPPMVRRARASTVTWGGPFWITVHAAGGWDPTVFCDPKGGVAGNKETVNQGYTKDQIVRSGEVPVAPSALSVDLGGGQAYEVYSARRFFDAHQGRLVVFNGVDTSTNNHDTGSRTVLAGRGIDGYPSISALAAGVAYETSPAPMAFLSYGGYDATGGAVPLTRASNVDNLWRVAFPNRTDPKKDDSNTYHSPATFARIQAAQAARVARLQGTAPMPSMRRALSTLLASRSGDTGLADVAKYLPEKLVSVDDFDDLKQVPAAQRGKLGELEGFMRQAQLTLAAFQAGVGIGASLVMGGFDTHADHDNQHVPQMVRLLRGVDYLFQLAAKLGLADKLYVVVGSDFGRTPYYNAGNGKDHWAVTSMMVSGPGLAGGRVFGATDDGFRPLTVNATTLRLDAGGIRLKPEHVHAALRKAAKLDTALLAQRFPVTQQILPFFA